jgi:SAM-dependent methyltransferase
MEMVTKRPIPKCKALEIGCGTGDNAIWLAQQDFVVTACDSSEIAIEKAIEKASKADVKCSFVVIEFLSNDVPGLPFSFVFDRGCFHSFDEAEERTRFAENVSSHLEKGGLWLSLIGNADEQRRGPGPPTRTAGDIVAAVEPFFEILLLTSSHLDSNRENPPRAWVCLMQKRDIA